MKINKAVTGELDGKPCIWLEDKEGNIKKLAQFVDEDSYEDFLKCVEAGYFMPCNKAPAELKPYQIAFKVVNDAKRRKAVA